MLLPIVMLVLAAMVQLSLLITCDQRLHEASLEGARVASQGGSQEEVELAVKRVLGRGRLAAAKVESLLEDEDGDPVAAGSSVAVTVTICAKQAVPGPLSFCGSRQLIGRAVMRKQ